MAEPRVNITIATQGQPQGAAAVTAALNETAAAGHRAAAALGNPWVTASANLDRANQMARKTAEVARRAAEETLRLGEAASRAAGNKRAQGLLQLGQALEDAEYGLRGVMNNIPGLVMSFGLGAGAAGILQIGLVAVSQVLRLLEGQQKQVQDGAIDWSKLTPEEEVEDKLRKVTEQLNQQAEALNKLAQARRDATTAEKEYADYLEALNKAKGRDELPEATMEEYQARTQARKNELARLPQDQAGLEAQAKAAEEAAQAQARKVADLEKLPGLQKDEADQAEKLQAARNRFSTSFAGSKGMMPPAEIERLQQQIRDEQAKLDAIRNQIRELPELEGADIPKGAKPEQVAEAKKAALQRQKDQAAELQKMAKDARERADAGARSLPEDMERIRREQNLDDIRTEAEVTKEAGLEDEKKADEERAKRAADRVRGKGKVVEPNPEDEYEYVPREGFIGRGERRLKKPREKSIEEIAGWQTSDPFESAPPPQAQPAAPAAGGAAVADIVAGLDEATNLAANNQAKQRLAELRALLTDGDGATARDVEMVLQALRQLNAGNAESQRAIAGTITALAQTQQAFAAEMGALRAQQEQLRTSINSMR